MPAAKSAAKPVAKKAAKPVAKTEPTFTDEYDVVVIGSGAGGLSAAVTAAYEGLSVLVLEREKHCGGATSWSGGWAWTPGTKFAKKDGVNETPEQFRTYLKSVIGKHYDAQRVDAFLAAAPEMVDFFETKTSLQWVPGAKIRDIYGHKPEAGTGHRSVGPKPYSSLKVRPEVRKIMRPQLYETSFLGMGIMAGPDLTKFLDASQGSIPGLIHAVKRFGRHVIDLVLFQHGTQLVNGTALTARLMKSGDDLGVKYWVNSPATELVTDAKGGVTGVISKTPTGIHTIRARRGVVLATGGFPQNVELRKKLFPMNPTGREHWTLAPHTADGAGLRLAESVGGYLKDDLESPAAWCPVSLVHYRTGRVGVFPHIMDRAKPGGISVRTDGKRFVNEANGYYDYVDGLIKATPKGKPVEAWMIGDSTFVKKYPLGFAKPRPVPKFSYLWNKYLIKAPTLTVLAKKCGIDAAQLTKTVAEFNRNARAGVDPVFERGSTEFNRYGGDPRVTPNPSLAPLEKGPFYAVKVLPGSFGTFAGIAADAQARVVTKTGKPVPGLYVAGNDQASIMGGFYPAGGINLGPALTFGYIAGKELAAAKPAATTAARKSAAKK